MTFGDDEDDPLVHAVDVLLTALVHRIDGRQDIPIRSKPARGQPSIELPPLAAAKVALKRTMREQGVIKAALAGVSTCRRRRSTVSSASTGYRA